MRTACAYMSTVEEVDPFRECWNYLRNGQELAVEEERMRNMASFFRWKHPAAGVAAQAMSHYKQFHKTVLNVLKLRTGKRHATVRARRLPRAPAAASGAGSNQTCQRAQTGKILRDRNIPPTERMAFITQPETGGTGILGDRHDGIRSSLQNRLSDTRRHIRPSPTFLRKMVTTH